MADILIRIDCPHCQGELIVVARELEEAESPVDCEGCGRALWFDAEAQPAEHRLRADAA